MSDENKLANEVMRGLDAQQLLDNPMLIAAFAEIEMEIETQWKLSKANEADAREKLYLMSRLLTNLKASIQSHVQTGKMANNQLLHLREKRQWFGTK